MSDTVTQHLTLQLEYYLRDEKAGGAPSDKWPVEPEFTNELRVDVYPDDDSPGLPAELTGKRLQVQLAGSPRALTELGKYLIAFAQIETEGEDPHEHFEDVQNENGQPVHLIVGRIDAR